MPSSEIVIRGAREHNLRDINLTLPKQKLIAMTGVSGSGKSSLAFDTVYAEGQRRYIESLSTYARQFLGQLPKPNVDLVSGLSPCISIQQKVTGRNPRSTVGTITEIYDYLRILYARVGQGYCYVSGLPIQAQTTDQIVETILKTSAGSRLLILAPLIQQQKGEYKDLFEDLLKQGYLRVRVDGEFYQLTEPPSLKKNFKHTIELVIDRLDTTNLGRTRLTEAVELALKMGQKALITIQEPHEGEAVEKYYSAQYACPESGMSYEPPSPQLFSFNSPLGMCPDCQGLGERYDFRPDLIVTDPTLTLSKGAIGLLGTFSKIGKAKVNRYRGAARIIEQQLKLKEGKLLKTAWQKLPAQAQQNMLYGLGEQEIVAIGVYGRRFISYYGRFDGIIGELLESYRTANNPMRKRQLEKYMETTVCSSCQGTRLNKQARYVRLATGNAEFVKTHGQQELSLPDVCGLTIAEAASFFAELQLNETQQLIAEDALREIRNRLGFLLQCGLDYLALDRTAPTLSGGESQRIRLAGQIGSGLSGIVYILDEPSIGLHPRDNDLLLGSLLDLRDMGNTVIVVEHDEETMKAADHIIDFGPGPGHRGGEVVAEGTLQQIQKNKNSVTGQYLSGKKKIEIPSQRKVPTERQLKIIGAKHNNLKNIDVAIPLGCFVCVTGVSGSGKSSVVNDILWQVLNRDINKGNGNPGKYDRIEGLELIDKAIDIDQTPIGRTPRSNPATYVKVFDLIRDLYTQLPAAKMRGYKPGRFSFNVAEGRCEACDGHGANKLDMDFLADMWVTCPVCEGKRFQKETLEIEYRGYSIADILDLEVGDALPLFENHPKIQRHLQALHDVGLDYLKLGQPSPTLSGGEAQRIKLARELGKRSTSKTVYLLDEPTTGLHFEDVRKLLEVLHRFCDEGNTVIVIEHHLDVIKTADWVIDIGPEGGAGGGTVLVAGRPEEVAACPASHTGRALLDVLPARKMKKTRKKSTAAKKLQIPRITSAELALQAEQITIRGARQHNLQDVDLIIPRNQVNVFSGPSGSGKTSLAMDTLYAEGQRRYVESLSAYARQFLGQMPKPKVTQIQGLSPAIAIEQKTVGATPRSTVGTVTEIYDYLRVLYTRLGQLYCPDCELPVVRQTVDEIVDQIAQYPQKTRALLTAAVSLPTGLTYTDYWEKLKGQGYSRVRIDGVTHHLDQPPKLKYRSEHRLEVVIDRLSLPAGKADRGRLAESVELALGVGAGQLMLVIVDEQRPETDWDMRHFSVHYSCRSCKRDFETMAPQYFSFNSSLGWCRACEGLGIEQGVRQSTIIADPTRTLMEGAIAVWPDPQTNSAFSNYLESLGQGLQIPLDIPFVRLTVKQQRLIYSGSEQSISLQGSQGVRFTYRGLYPALHEASRLSYDFRRALFDEIGEQCCSVCQGTRLRGDAAAVRLGTLTLPQFCQLPLNEALKFLGDYQLDSEQQKVAGDLIWEATHRLKFLVDVGLHYLTLDRSMPTLSGGESQRIRLAGQLGRALTGVLYVLDEPTIGLHPRDNRRLIEAINRLRDLGNTVIMVEHDREVIEAADQVYDFGPAAGRLGGKVVAAGPPQEVAKQAKSLTGQYLSHKLSIPLPAERRPLPEDVPIVNDADDDEEVKFFMKKIVQRKWIDLIGARHHNLRNVNLKIPLGVITCVTGVSGSGKSSLIMDTLALAAKRVLAYQSVQPGVYDELHGMKQLSKVVVVDQQPIGNTPASCPATYVGVFDAIRDLFTKLPEAKKRGYRQNRFSFNVDEGRCGECNGLGQKCIEMHFLPDVWIECPACRGQRFNDQTLQIEYKNQNISDILNLSIQQAAELFADVPRIYAPLKVLCEIGLDYLTLGQSAPTLSGGESQRIKLAAELSRTQFGKTLYILDEPTTGLHVDDIAKLLKVLNGLADLGNTIVVVEHNLDVIKTADWIVDIGPEAGNQGGWIVAEGRPEEVAEQAQQLLSETKFIDPAGKIRWRSWTGEMLTPVLQQKTRQARETVVLNDLKQAAQQKQKAPPGKSLPWLVDGKNWHLQQKSLSGKADVRWKPAILENFAQLFELYQCKLNWEFPDRVEVLCPSDWLFDFDLHNPQTKTWCVASLKTSLPEYLELTLQWPYELDHTGLEEFHHCLASHKTGDNEFFNELYFSINKQEELEDPSFRKLLEKLLANTGSGG